MKNLILFLTAVALTVLSSNVFGQTGVAPVVGGVYTYSVTQTGSNTLAWDVTSDVEGTTSVVGSAVTLSSSSGNSIDITWGNPVVGTTYYVHVIETDASTSCTNRKALAATVANNFTLEIESVDLTDADTDNGVDATICPAAVSVTAYTGTAGATTLVEARKFTYDYSADVAYYKISASGINTSTTGWSPQFTIGHSTITGATYTAFWATAIDGTYTTTSLNVDGTTNDIDVGSGNSAIWVKVTVDNGASDASGNEGIASANDLLVTLIGSAGTSEDEHGNDVTSVGNGNRKQIISLRPATSVITTTE